MIVEPPLDAGAVHWTRAVPLPGVAVTLVGAPGVVRGVAGVEAVEGVEVPAVLVAVTVKV